MIIKDKPFSVPCCQAVWCWYYASPVVVGPAIPSSFGCHVDLVRRWPGFLELEAYQVRLIGYLVRNWTRRTSDRVLDRYQSGLVHAGGIW